MMLSEQYAQRVYKSDSEPASQLFEILAAASKEAEKGAAMLMPPIIWTARKSV